MCTLKIPVNFNFKQVGLQPQAGDDGNHDNVDEDYAERIQREREQHLREQEQQQGEQGTVNLSNPSLGSLTYNVATCALKGP